ncbi:MAG TPA: nuclear transport factor 2 family protein [Myxococcaceae bacterium]|nr:nuclear transport factor 2 family protein [Myxococcaceae bacterium]
MHARLLFVVPLLLLGSPVRSESQDAPARRLTTAEFKSLMNQLAEAWNANDARRAVELFTQDAVYSAPPDGRVRRGRDELLRFFGGPAGRPRPMRMEWHHLVFDEASQIGSGEYTFTYDVRTHGVTMVRIVGGLISNWREYEQASPLDWEAFVGPNRF